MTNEEISSLSRVAARVTRMSRAYSAMTDSVRLATDALVRADRREWEYPNLVLSDEERDAIRARQLGRTLADIDDLPEAER